MDGWWMIGGWWLDEWWLVGCYMDGGLACNLIEKLFTQFAMAGSVN
jgi:hypothetical protein